MSEPDPPELPPHRDPARWDRVVEGCGPESILVVLNGWIGPALSRHVSAEDIWQETLMHAWRDREKHEYRSQKAYRSWLLEIAKNRIRDAADRIAAQKRGGGDEAVEFSTLQTDAQSLSAILPGRSTTPSVIAAFGERAKLMTSALEELDEDGRFVVRAHLFEERAMTDVAAELGIAEATAWYRFRKGAEAYARALSRLEAVTPRPREE